MKIATEGVVNQPKSVKPVFDDIAEVFEAEASRFSGWAEPKKGGVGSSIGGIPAGYQDEESQLNFPRKPANLRRIAEEKD